MPWTVKDLEEHKFGLNDSQKQQWVAIANSVLKRCTDNGGEEEKCAVTAIRQANGVIEANSKYSVYNNNNDEYQLRSETHGGKEFIVVPVTMMVEGVHSGSHGPILHTIDELGRFPGSWDGIPVVINHPANEDGINISANSPQVIDKVSVGRVYNTHVDGSRLKAEAWIDPDKLMNVSPETMALINEKKIIEVSIGAYVDDEPVTGEWNGEQYSAIAKNHRPDHLALLPGGIGACSVNDGCGIRVNDNTNTKFIRTKMSKKEECAGCMEKVIAIINSNSTKFTKDDREWLLTQDESVLDKLIPESVGVTEVVKEVVKEVPVALSAEDQAALEYGRSQLAANKAKSIADIQANTSKETWPDELLANMSMDMLERLATSVRKQEVVNYALNGNSSAPVNANTEVLLPTGIEVK